MSENDTAVVLALLLSHAHLHYWGFGGEIGGGNSSEDPESDPCGGNFALPVFVFGYPFFLMGFFLKCNLLLNLCPLFSLLALLLLQLPQL